MMIRFMTFLLTALAGISSTQAFTNRTYSKPNKNRTHLVDHCDSLTYIFPLLVLVHSHSCRHTFTESSIRNTCTACDGWFATGIYYTFQIYESGCFGRSRWQIQRMGNRTQSRSRIQIISRIDTVIIDCRGRIGRRRSHGHGHLEQPPRSQSILKFQISVCTQHK